MEPIVRNNNDDPTFRLYGQPDYSYREDAMESHNKIGELIIYKEDIYTRQYSLDHPDLNEQLEFLNSENYYVLHRDDLLAIRARRLNVSRNIRMAVNVSLIICGLLLLYVVLFWY